MNRGPPFASLYCHIWSTYFCRHTLQFLPLFQSACKDATEEDTKSEGEVELPEDLSEGEVVVDGAPCSKLDTLLEEDTITTITVDEDGDKDEAHSSGRSETSRSDGSKSEPQDEDEDEDEGLLEE